MAFVQALSIFLNEVIEYFSLVWVELVLGILSAVVYIMFSKRRVRSKSGRSKAARQNSLLQTHFKQIGYMSSSARATSAASDGSISPRSSTADDNTFQDFFGTKDRLSKKVTMRANDIRSCGRNGNLKGAIKVFEKLGRDADDTLVLNSILDACVECQDVTQALYYFNRAKFLQLADSVTYNKMMKGYLAQGREAEVWQLLSELVSKGLQSATSYHGLLNARVNAGDMRAAWKIVAEMQLNGSSPNAVTCAILLKGKLQLTEEVSRVLVLVDAMDDPMDEVLFMAVAEACVRIGRLDVLSRQMEKFKHRASGSLSAETYGSMIKAYGRARDTQRVWDLWHQMLRDDTKLTSVTLGCMVEALVANWQSGKAWALVQDLLEDETTRLLVNTVICSSIVKGLAYSKDAEKVMSVYKEMQARSIQPNAITFNTILNAFAQCGTMHYAPEILADMKATAPAVEPDVVTYSTLVKGYCSSGSVDRALQVLSEMQCEGKCAPDEVLFNSLLGGCAKEFRLDDALHLLGEMRKLGVAPSNYTLSMLVKLMCRCKRLDQAFTVLEDISREYKLRINIQVYTCLMQGCFHEGRIQRALDVYDKIIAQKLAPDAMTYTVMIRGCLRAGDIDKATELLQHAHGIGVGAPFKRHSSPGVNPGCMDEVVDALGGSQSERGAEILRSVHYCTPPKLSNGDTGSTMSW